MLACQSMAQDSKPMDIDKRVLSMSAESAKLTAPSAGSPQSLADDVSSLRALALSTMRLKRKRDDGNARSAPSAPSQTLPARPVPQDNVFLDYGSEAKEDLEAPATESIPSTSTISETKPTISEEAVEEEIKEEGEISDEEPRASSIASSSSPADGARNSFTFVSRKAVPTQPAAMRSMITEPLRSPLPAYTEQHSRQPSTAPPDRDLWSDWVPSENHVRPGLKMNMEQFNLAKELILDLLGWGVAPEYLIDCGLTREAVFYTFMELNLRLPKNLDVNGLLPSRQTPQPPGPAAANNGLPSSGLPLKPDTSSLDVGKMSHPLPVKPLGQVASSDTSAASTVPTTPTYPNGQNLSDMEAQRRQELLARKAVLASRRKKTLPTSSGESSSLQTSPVVSKAPSNVLDEPIVDEPVPISATSAVDDFLKNVMETTTSSHSSTPTPTVAKGRTLSGGVPLGISSGNAVSPSAIKKSPIMPTFPDAMDIDSGVVPGLGSSRSRPSTVSTPGTTAAPVPSVPTPLSVIGAIPRNANRLSVDQVLRTASAPHADQRPKPESVPVSPAPRPALNGRRGAKRPVAMDFVDAEDNRSAGQSETSMPPPFIRRKLGGFAGLGGHVPRKCVIDLSDSEDDGNDGPRGEKQAEDDGQATDSAPQNTSHRVATPASAPRPQINRPSSSVGFAPTKAATPKLSPEALAEKERQITQMREMIAKREQERLRKLAEKSRTPIDTPRPATPTTNQNKPEFTSTTVTGIKMEEADINLLPSTATTAMSRLVPQPFSSESSSSSNDQADEDIVMQSLEVPGTTSESALPTPIDIKPIKLEHSTTGEGVLTEEAREEEPGDAPEEPQDSALAMPVDVANMDASSAQIDSPQDNTLFFSEYNSPFSSYPLLRSRSRVVADLADVHLSSSSYLVSTTSSALSASSTSSTLVGSKITIPDLRPLRVAVVSRETERGSGGRICQFEVPGGGECRDKACKDLHLSDLEPDDHEIARYLLETMPDVLKGYDESEIADQLVQAKQKKSGTTKAPVPLEERVTEAISSLVGLGR